MPLYSWTPRASSTALKKAGGSTQVTASGSTSAYALWIALLKVFMTIDCSIIHTHSCNECYQFMGSIMQCIDYHIFSSDHIFSRFQASCSDARATSTLARLSASVYSWPNKSLATSSLTLPLERLSTLLLN